MRYTVYRILVCSRTKTRMISSLRNFSVRILGADRFTIVIFQILDIKSNYLPGIVHSIPLFWCMEDYTLQSSNNRKDGEVSQIKYNTARSLRSALSMATVWSSPLASPDDKYQDRYRNLFTTARVGPTSNVLIGLTAN
jgi:hypothetical protein